MAKKKLTNKQLVKKVGKGRCLCCGEVTKDDFCDKCIFDAFVSKDIWAHLVKTAIRNTIIEERTRLKSDIKWYDWILTTKD